MISDQNTYRPKPTAFLRAGLLAVLAFAGANAAQAQSAYGCRTLESHAPLPAVEGKDGIFFAIRPELQSYQGMADETIASLADLNTALASGGTTLVILPVPTRAQVHDRKLPVMASNLGFDIANATAVHIEMLHRMRGAGLTVADARGALRIAANAGERPFFEADMRPTPLGARLLAAAVGEALAAHPEHAERPTANYVSTAGSEVTLPSPMRMRLQTACQSELPAVRATSFTTARSGGTATSEAANRLVVLGTDITKTEVLNFKGFLAEATGFETLGYGVTQGGAFAAISSYLTSTDFQVSPPRVLVWEFPVATSLAAHGDQPIKELVAAARNLCEQSLTTTRTPTGERLRADLSSLPHDVALMLSLDMGGANTPYVRFHFTGADGQKRTRSIYRHPDQLLTGRFFLPLSGLNAAGLVSVEVEAPTGFGTQSRLAVCS